MANDPRLDPNSPLFDKVAFARAYIEGLPAQQPEDPVPVGFDGTSITQPQQPEPSGAQALAQQFVQDPSAPLPPEESPQGAQMSGLVQGPGAQVDLGQLGATFDGARQRQVSRPRVVQAQGPTQRTFREMSPVTAEALRERQQILDRSFADEEEAALREREGARLAAETEAEKARILEEQVREQQARDAERKRAVDAEFDKLAAIQDDILGTEIDPNRAWTRLDTGNKIAVGIGALLGGFGQAFAGGSNPALDIIDRALDRDLQAQMKAADMKVQAGRFQESIYNKVREQFNDADQSALATRLVQLQALDKDLAAKQAATSIPSQQEVLRRTRDHYAMRANDLKMQLGQQYEATVQTSTRPVVVGGGGAAKLGSKDARLERPDGGIPGFRVDDPGAFAQIANDDTSYRKLRDVVQGSIQVQEAAARMRRLRETYGTEWNSEAASEYKEAKGQLIGGVNLMRGGGAVQEGEYARLDEEIPDLGPQLADIARLGGIDVVLNKITGLERGLGAAANAKLRASGGSLQGVRRGQAATSDSRMRAQEVVR